MDIDNALEYIPQNFKIITKADRFGDTSLAPMVLWPAQKHYIENSTRRDVCVKSRQQGFSCAVMARNAHLIFTRPYQRATIITHDQETSEFLFQTVQRFHRNLSPEKRPRTDWKSGHRMRFQALDSYIYIDSAKSDSLGIGHTLNLAHLSEVARWPTRRAYDLFADISQTVPEGGYITLESTPEGRAGLFYDIYQSAKKGENNYKPFFYPWWWDVTCVREASEYPKELTKEETLLIEGMNLNPQQIAFRREKLGELNDLFYREYPENDVDCWLTGEMSVYDGVAIRRYLMQVQEGRQDGNVTIWKDVIGGEKYVIGVDTAGGHEKGDFSVASVVKCKTNEYVARYRARIAPDMFAQELLRLGRRFNDAEIGVERIMHGSTILHILISNNYPNIYYSEDYDTFSQTVSREPGWKTSRVTKPIMVDTLNSMLSAGDLITWSENFLMEASGLTRDGQKIIKPSGGFDDEVDALAIALQLRENTSIYETKDEDRVFTYH